MNRQNPSNQKNKSADILLFSDLKKQLPRPQGVALLPKKHAYEKASDLTIVLEQLSDVLKHN